MKKFEEDSWEIKEHSEWFYRDREGNIYPYLKEEIKKEIDPFIPSTFISILKDMNYPFIEEEWINTLYYEIRKEKISFTISKYISKMNLRSFRALTFEDSDRINSFSQYNNGISIKECKYAIALKRIENENE